jgi:hypothetical protein
MKFLAHSNNIESPSLINNNKGILSFNVIENLNSPLEQFAIFNIFGYKF